MGLTVFATVLLLNASTRQDQETQYQEKKSVVHENRNFDVVSMPRIEYPDAATTTETAAHHDSCVSVFGDLGGWEAKFLVEFHHRFDSNGRYTVEAYI